MRFSNYKKKSKNRDRRGRHTKAERIARIRAAKKSISPYLCRGCNKELNSAIRTEEGDAIVCTNCGLVDDNVCFDYEAPVYDHVPRSPLYRHRNYFAEKLLQARNKEPRLSEKELDIISVIYDIYRDHCPDSWNEANFTKRHMGQICRVIKSVYPNSPFCRRIERWYQYRVYICGNSGYDLDFYVASHLRVLFDAYVHYFLIYLEENNFERKNITQLDLVILILMYNLDKTLLAKYGWYFLNHNIVNCTPSIERDLEVIKQVCNMCNTRLLNDKKSYDITTLCYVWFRKHGPLQVPSLKNIITRCMENPLGVMQYVTYRTCNPAGYVEYLNSSCKEAQL